MATSNKETEKEKKNNIITFYSRRNSASKKKCEEVLKCSFYFYLGMMKPKDQKMTIIGKNSLLLTISKRWDHAVSCKTTLRSTRVGQESRIVRGKCEQEALFWFSWKKKGKAS